MIFTLSDIQTSNLEDLKQNIQTAIDKDKIDARHTYIKQGTDYYVNNTDILSAQKTYFDENGAEVTDPTRANNKVTHSFYPLLVKQKVGYLLGKPINFACEDKNVNDYLKSILGAKWDMTAQELLKNASNKGDEWLYCYIDRAGEFTYTVCPTEQIIPLYDNAFKTNLDGVIRYYNTTNLQGDIVKHWEFWTREKVMYFTDTELVAESAHFLINGKGYSFGELPFIQFRNNAEMTTDLSLVKDLIDNYDKVVSGLANDLDDIQDSILILKGYQGTDPAEFNKNLKFFKLIKVDDTGDVTKLEIKIPVDAKDSHLKRLEDDIYRLGMGVDVSAEKLGNSSGVALKFIYSLLDLKSDMSEAQFRQGIEHFLKVISNWYGTIYGTPFERDTVKVTFNRSFIVNTKEQIVNCVNSVGLISAETMLANHPFVQDVDYEKERIENEGINPAWLNQEAKATNTSNEFTSQDTTEPYEHTGETPENE